MRKVLWSTVMSSEAHSYKREEVAKHCSTEDCWIILHNKVYDVTKFLSRHPGGEAVILKVAGRDATEQFESVRHSAEARDLAAKLTIGNLDPSEHREYKSGCSLM